MFRPTRYSSASWKNERKPKYNKGLTEVKVHSIIPMDNRSIIHLNDWVYLEYTLNETGSGCVAHAQYPKLQTVGFPVSLQKQSTIKP